MPLNKDNFSPVLYKEVDDVTFCKHKGGSSPEEYLFNIRITLVQSYIKR
jgi:hypothetical protein